MLFSIRLAIQQKLLNLALPIKIFIDESFYFKSPRILLIHWIYPKTSTLLKELLMKRVSIKKVVLFSFFLTVHNNEFKIIYELNPILFSLVR